jgi:hypothetical protein
MLGLQKKYIMQKLKKKHSRILCFCQQHSFKRSTVTTIIAPSLLFCRHVLSHGFSPPLVLPSSHHHDSVLCSTVADLDWDGTNELLLGTFGKVRVRIHSKAQQTTGAAALENRLCHSFVPLCTWSWTKAQDWGHIPISTACS